VVKVKLFSNKNIFLLAQANGVVGFYNIRSCELISYLNQESWSPVLSGIARQLVKKSKHAKRELYKASFREYFSDEESDLSTQDRASETSKQVGTSKETSRQPLLSPSDKVMRQ